MADGACAGGIMIFSACPTCFSHSKILSLYIVKNMCTMEHKYAFPSHISITVHLRFPSFSLHDSSYLS